MSMAMIRHGLESRLGVGSVEVWSLGFGPEGLPAIREAVEAMQRRGLDVSGHRSRKVTSGRIESADLVLTSERQHVVGIAGLSSTMFRRTLTLPEFLERAEADPDAAGRSLAEWTTDLTADRTPAGYLRASVPEVDDPTGLRRQRFEDATAHIESMCAAAVDAISRSR